MTLWLLALGAAALVQLWWWRRHPAQELVGDEAGYARSAHADDPYQLRAFLRVPAMATLARALRGPDLETTALRLRLVSLAAGLLSFAVALWNAELQAGSTGLVVAAMTLLWLPERLVLNQHVWPDPLLGLLITLLTSILILPEHSTAVIALAGLLIALAVLTRIDQLVLLPAAGLALAGMGALGWRWGLLVAPTLVALALWTLRNGRRYGIWLPDTTVAFNLRVMGHELAARGAGRTTIQDLVLETVNAPRNASMMEILGAVLRNPLRWLRDLVVRALSMLAGDTFVRQRLFAPLGLAYPAPPVWLAIWLRVAWPVVVGLLVAGLVANPRWHDALYPTLGAFIAFILVHSRTRYRLICFPGVALWLAILWSGELQRLAMAVPAGLLATVALAAFEWRTEDQVARRADG